MKISPGKSKIIGFLAPAMLFGLALLIKSWYMTPSVSDGEPAQDFTARIIDGTSLKLSELRGGPVLLHFWGSWCAPCRQQNPGLVALAREQGDGIDIVSIAIEKDSSRWRAAIEKDGLFWPNQIMDATTSLKFLNGPISDLYGVNSVPTEFLLDAEGKLVATNPSTAEIRNFLADAR